MTANPLLAPFDTPFGLPPFSQIRDHHFLPAYELAMANERQEVEAILTNPEAPTFANTVEALARCGEQLARVHDVFSNLKSADSRPALQEIAREVASKIAAHNDAIRLDQRLFDRVGAVFQQRAELGLTAEQLRLLEETHKRLVRGGARLVDDDKRRLEEIHRELSELSVQFANNLLEEMNAFELVIEREADLDGLPALVRAAAADEARNRGQEGKWVFTLHGPSYQPFLRDCRRRDLREKMYRAYVRRGDGGEFDNRPLAERMAVLRLQRARLLGYRSHAHYVLEESMAKSPDGVRGLLDRLWPLAAARAQAEGDEIQAMIDAEGGGFELQPWDWAYYAEQVRQQRYELDEQELRPYFNLDNVRQGAFEVAGRLFGLSFEECREVPVFHDEVQAWEVKDGDGTHLGLLLTDYHPRPGKKVGAWMDAFREQQIREGRNIRPIIVNVCNFPRPTAGQPALLGIGEVETLFHEFGHALHGLLSQSTYTMFSGTNVPRDFVEFPSQLLENWATEPTVLRRYARHWQTGEPIPEALIEKLDRARLHNQGFRTVEYLAASYLDLAWHTLEDAEAKPRVDEIEGSLTRQLGLMPEISFRYRSPYFAHIFAGGYAAGYYSYVWAEVLDADGFAAFEQRGDIFDRELAAALRHHVLEAGGTAEPEDLYRAFRGAEPAIEPLLERRGLAAETTV